MVGLVGLAVVFLYLARVLAHCGVGWLEFCVLLLVWRCSDF